MVKRDDVIGSDGVVHHDPVVKIVPDPAKTPVFPDGRGPFPGISPIRPPRMKVPVLVDRDTGKKIKIPVPIFMDGVTIPADSIKPKVPRKPRKPKVSIPLPPGIPPGEHPPRDCPPGYWWTGYGDGCELIGVINGVEAEIPKDNEHFGPGWHPPEVPPPVELFTSDGFPGSSSLDGVPWRN